MQDLDSQPAGFSVGVPKLNIPIKWIAIIVVVLVFLAAIYVVVEWASPKYDDSALWGAVQALNSSVDLKAGKDWANSNFNSFNSRMDQLTSQFGTMKTDIAQLKSDLKGLKLNNTNNTDVRLSRIESRMTSVESTLSKLGNLSWVGGFPVANSSTPVKYLCDVTGVPVELKFQYTFQCTCDLRKTYGPYLNAGAACIVNRDNAACACYDKICASKVGIC